MIKKTLITVVCILVAISPLIGIFIKREYDIEQFFVPNSFNYDVTPFAELNKNHYLVQSFKARADSLTGVDLVLSQSQSPVVYELIDPETKEIIRSGEITMKGEVRVTRIRFSPISLSRDRKFELFLQGQTAEGPHLAYSNGEKACKQCSLAVDGEIVDGNANLTPVYKADSLIGFTKILFQRLKSNLKVYAK
ncbi:hypothetical protein H6764_00155 [Candidatus Nomurabacteria bacterium]|nr:hypothetical protein [Candidatus Nomurabacteria bacterium]